MLKSTVHMVNPFLYALGTGLQTRIWTYLTSARYFFRGVTPRAEILVGDLNKVSMDPYTGQLSFLCSLYQIDQLIDKPTRVTDT